ncbi:MAG TPA: HupE/UreJ family protein [Pirellulales bacterium]|jgi:hydrogenase/urease accessory protein HupE|nr:HupE/UreJ family protein [Pirellulales bacterium]
MPQIAILLTSTLRTFGRWAAGAALTGFCFALLGASAGTAHPLLENALDVVIARDRIVIDARISEEEILLLAAGEDARAPTEEQVQQQIKSHGDYVLRHVRLRADGKLLSGKAIPVGDPMQIDRDAAAANTAPMYAYQLDYPLPTPPKQVTIEQDFLIDFPAWTAPCVLRIRRADQDAFDTSLLKRGKVYAFACEWPADATPADASSIRTTIDPWRTFWEYLGHGVEHILTGYDHLLFVTALVLAATRLWDLVKVVTAFTCAHTLTLTLAVFNIVNISERLVEPVISASIIFVAVQNIFWPEKSTGWSRLAVAFGFGLFHGLGFAGGLKDAMQDLPTMAIGLALLAFSLGVELGHQCVILPEFTLLQLLKRFHARQPRVWLMNRIRQFGSAAIALGGCYFLYEAMQMN